MGSFSSYHHVRTMPSCDEVAMSECLWLHVAEYMMLLYPPSRCTLHPDYVCVTVCVSVGSIQWVIESCHIYESVESLLYSPRFTLDPDCVCVGILTVCVLCVCKWGVFSGWLSHITNRKEIYPSKIGMSHIPVAPAQLHLAFRLCMCMCVSACVCSIQRDIAACHT